MGTIHVGTAGWSYKDWYGIVYPEKPGKDFKELDFLATMFNTVEVNSTFYKPANAFMGSAWVRKVAHNPDFLFTLKLWQRFTHQRTPYSATDVKTYLDGIDPIAEAGKLGALLIQFPWSFKNTEHDRKWMAGLFKTFNGYPLVVELRHGTWDIPPTYDFLNNHNVGFASIDQPVIGDSIEPKPVQTGNIGYVRLHGRNYKNWFPPKNTKPDEKIGAGARYDYLYNENEITTWAQNSKEVSKKATQTFVIQNNHPWGQAVANSIQLKAALGEAVENVPETLIKRYPVLESLRKQAK